MPSYLPKIEGSHGTIWGISLDDLEKAMEVIPGPILGIQRRIWVSACTVAYHGDVSFDYVVSRDQFIGHSRAK